MSAESDNKRLYRLGREILGDQAGGLLAKLKKTHGLTTAALMLLEASLKDDPVAYLAAVLREAKPADQPRAVSHWSDGLDRATFVRCDALRAKGHYRAADELRCRALNDTQKPEIESGQTIAKA